MNLTLTCPACGVELDVADVAPGDVIECSECHAACTVPAPPPAHVVARRAPPAPVYATTQRTSKKWKVGKLLGLVLLAGGIVVGIQADKAGDVDRLVPAAVVAFAGAGLWIVSRACQWWTND